MTMLHLEGFDHIVTADVGKKGWNWAGTAGTIHASNGRRGGGCLEATAAERGPSFPINSLSRVIAGGAFYFTNMNQAYLAYFVEGGQGHVVFELGLGWIRVSRRWSVNAVTLGTVHAPIRSNAWHYLEFDVTVHDTTGAVKMRVDNVEVLNLTNQDTRDGGTGVISHVCMFPCTAGRLDDVYVLNPASSPNNSFLGDLRVDTVLPTVDGNYEQWALSAGSDSFDLVNEATPSETDYLSSATVDQISTFGFADLTTLSSQTIRAVQLSSHMKKTDAGPRTTAGLCRRAGTDYPATAQSPPTSSVYMVDRWEVDPNTAAAWTEANVNAAEFGVKVVT